MHGIRTLQSEHRVLHSDLYVDAEFCIRVARKSFEGERCDNSKEK